MNTINNIPSISNKINFKGYIKFRNGVVIDANKIAYYKVDTVRREIPPEEFDAVVFTDKTDIHPRKYLYYDTAKKSYEWMVPKTKPGQFRGLRSLLNVSLHSGIMDFISGIIKMEDGKTFEFDYPKVIAPPCLKEVKDGNQIIEEFPRGPISNETFEDVILKAKKENRVIKVGAKLYRRILGVRIPI